jgi:hypothetical protein
MQDEVYELLMPRLSPDLIRTVLGRIVTHTRRSGLRNWSPR